MINYYMISSLLEKKMHTNLDAVDLMINIIIMGVFLVIYICRKLGD